MPPNILLIVTDQQAFHALSCTGNSSLSTPHLDRLAAEGTRFSRAYCTQPLCTPSRASLYTGHYPHEVGATDNTGELFYTHSREDTQWLGQLLTAGGYDCGYLGKDPFPDERWGMRPLAPFRGDRNASDHAIQFLRQCRGTPFLLAVNYLQPHNICEFARNQRLTEDAVALPGNEEDLPPLPPNFGIAGCEAEVIRMAQRQAAKVYPVANYSDEDWRRYLYAYYRMVEQVDRETGRLLEALDEAGLTENTLVLFTSDHGDGCAAHQWNQKTALFEEIVRVPLIVRQSGTFPAGEVVDEPVSIGTDIVPTLCAAAGVEPPAYAGGTALQGYVAPGEAPSREAVLVETTLMGKSAQGCLGRAVITKRWKYVAYAWGRYREQLFDLERDPGEMQNLAVSGLYGAVLEEMRERLRAHCEETDDRFRRFV